MLGAEWVVGDGITAVLVSALSAFTHSRISLENQLWRFSLEYIGSYRTQHNHFHQTQHSLENLNIFI